MRKLFQVIICFTLLIAITGCSGTRESLGISTGGIENDPVVEDITTDTTETPEDQDANEDSDTPTDVPTPDSNETSTDTPVVPDTPKDEGKKDPVTTTPDAPVQIPDNSGKQEEVLGCTHTTTSIINKAAVTCTQAGYSGDTACTTCNQVLTQGSTITATGHRNTEIRNQKDATTSAAGYTGDTYCKDCGVKVSSGTTIPKLQEDTSGKYPYELPDGTIIYVNDGIDIRKYTMKQATKSVSHQYSAVEQEILRLVNIERNKAGLSSLSWYEDAYCFTKTRAVECLSKFSHTRPNGTSWDTVYTDSGVLLYGTCGENLHLAQGYSIEEIAAQTVSDWMESPSHRANILDSKYKQIAIAVVKDGDKISSVQNFFG